MKILITRPEPKAQELKLLCQAQNITAEVLPLLVVQHKPLQVWHEAFNKALPVDALIFVSSNAVQSFVAAPLDEHLKKLPCFTLGASTAELLLAHGFSRVIYPKTQENSEHLLALAPLQQVAGKHFLIIRGDSGRELVADTLTERGAVVTYLAVYERARRILSAAELHLLQAEYGVIVVTSMDALRYLLELRAPKTEKIMVMPGQMQTLAQKYYAERMILTASFDNFKILKLIKDISMRCS
jgi:uroporphyrinogen-III synthase